MKVTLYSTNCPKCRVLEQKLNMKNVEYEVVTDKDKIMKVAEEHGIGTAPILVVDDEVFDFPSANRYIMGM